MKLAIVVVLGLWVTVELGNAAFGMENGDACGDGKVLHANKEGLNRCCLRIDCGPGTEAELCDAFKPTTCIGCKSGTFQSDTIPSFHMIKCRQHTHCNGDAVVSQPGSATTDVMCICNLKLGYYGSSPDCYIGVSCEPGHQLMLNGTCEQCPPNFYQTSSNSLPCSPCSRCDSETQEIDIDCSPVSDTVCRNKTLGHPEEVNNTSEVGFLLLIILSVVVPVIIVMVIICCIRKCRNQKTSCRNREASCSGVSTSNESMSQSDPSIECGSLIEQHDCNILKEEVKENRYHQCMVTSSGDTEQDTQKLIHLRGNSLCESETIRSVPNSDFVHHRRRSDSVGVLNSPSEDLSSMDTPVNLIDEREDAMRDNQQSVQYMVETGLPANDSLPSNLHGATVMKGKYNAYNGNVLNFTNCNIKFVQPKEV